MNNEMDSLGLEGVNPDPTAVVTVGTFDGVHLGHQRIIGRVVELAARTGGTSTVVTFDPHPREVTTGSLVPLLSTIDERRALFRQFGIVRSVVIPFTRAFARMSPTEFIADVIADRVGCQVMVTGHDHGFGKGRSGDRTSLAEAGAVHGFSLETVPPYRLGDTLVSSTAIREHLIEGGDIQEVARLLGRLYSLDGNVVRGEGRGRTIGYPTANLEVASARKVIPRRGVYAVHVDIHGERHGGMMNIGIRPTFGGTKTHLEVHILDFDQQIYGDVLHIEFVERLRDETRFASIQELVGQLSEDERRCRDALRAVS